MSPIPISPFIFCFTACWGFSQAERGRLKSTDNPIKESVAMETRERGIIQMRWRGLILNKNTEATV
ncbi:MAG: hypothetical protein GX842_00645 [Spirochaetales bacterium]|nr:hypothetical protein [Spirochaetales bacterium]